VKRIRYAAAAEYLGIPVGTLRYLVSRKEVPHLRLGPREVVFETDALDAWLAKHRHGYEK
jgi:excisionase family DNA binding protein